MLEGVNMSTEAIIDFANALEAACVNLRMQLGDKAQHQLAAVNEATFTTLRFDPAEGERLGNYEIAYANGNLPDKFTYAYNILRQSNATIQKRYHGEGYAFSYWLYGENKIYRQKLKQETSKKDEW
jgi:hypothetical protein